MCCRCFVRPGPARDSRRRGRGPSLVGPRQGTGRPRHGGTPHGVGRVSARREIRGLAIRRGGTSAGGREWLLPAREVRRDARDRRQVSGAVGEATAAPSRWCWGRDAILGSRGTQPKVDHRAAGVHRLRPPSAGSRGTTISIRANCRSSSIKGKIVVYVNGGPGDLSAALKSFARTSPLAEGPGRCGRSGRDLDSHAKIDGLSVGSRGRQRVAAGHEAGGGSKGRGGGSPPSRAGGPAPHHVLGDFQPGRSGEAVCGHRPHVCGTAGAGRCAKAAAALHAEEEPGGHGDDRKQQCGVAQYRGQARGLRCRAEEGIRAGLGAPGPPG